MTVTRDQLRNWLKRDKRLKPHAKPLSPEEQADADICEAMWIKWRKRADESPRRTAYLETVTLEEARAILEAKRPKTEGERALVLALESWRRFQFECPWPRKPHRRTQPVSTTVWKRQCDQAQRTALRPSRPAPAGCPQEAGPEAAANSD